MTELTIKVKVDGKDVSVAIIDVNTDEVKAEDIVGLECCEKPHVTDRLFDETCPGWTRDPQYNMMFLLDQQIYFTDKLRAKKQVCLNEVFDALGFVRTKFGQVNGWIYDENKQDGNFVDFGINREYNADFIDGKTSYCWLSFNIDGNILELME
jgi:hypothetical protein